MHVFKLMLVVEKLLAFIASTVYSTVGLKIHLLEI